MFKKIVKWFFVGATFVFILSGCASSHEQTVFGVPLSTWNSMSEQQQRALISSYYNGRGPAQSHRQRLIDLHNQ